MRRLAALLAVTTIFAAPAHAEDKALIMPLDGSAPAAPELADALQRRLAQAAEKAGVAYELGKVPAAEVAMMAGCDPVRVECRAQIAALLEADVVVTGTIAPARGKAIRVTVLKYDTTGEKTELSRELVGENTGELLAEFDPLAEEFFPPAEGASDPVPEPPPEEPAPLAPPPEALTPPANPEADSGEFSFGAVEPYSWAVLGGGGLLVAGGVAALLSAESKQEELDGAPSNSLAELEALEDLESSARTRYRLSYALFALGTIGVGAGAALVVTQGRESVSIAPTPMPGGGGVALGGQF